MDELRRTDLAWCVNTLPREVRSLMKSNPRRLVLAGGYVRDRVVGNKPSDIDLFAPSKDMAELWANKLLCNPGERVVATKNAYTIAGRDIPIQVIHRWTYDSPEMVVGSFDFTIAMAAIWFDGEWKSMVHDDFYCDLAGKRLVYTSPERNEDAGGSILRVLKFYQRGYRIPLDSMGAVCARFATGLKGIDFTEERMARVFTGLLREVDPYVDPEHFAHLPESRTAPDVEEEPVELSN